MNTESKNTDRKIRNTNKRMYFPDLVKRGLIVTAVITVIYILCICTYISQMIGSQCKEQMMEYHSQIVEQAGALSKDEDGPMLLHDLEGHLSFNSLMYNFSLYPVFDMPDSFETNINPELSSGFSTVSLIIDENNNIAASNRRKIISRIRFIEDENSNGYYFCERQALNDPQIDRLFKDYDEMIRISSEKNLYFEIIIESAYINKEDRTFVPKKGLIRAFNVKNNSFENYTDRKIDIELSEPEYEIMEFDNDVSNIVFTQLCGEQEDTFDMLSSDCSYHETNQIGAGYSYSKGEAVYDMETNMYINGEKYLLTSRFRIDYSDRQIVMYFIKSVVLFVAVILAVMLLFCWRKSVLNKARYAFEDYQRTLTNNLAHDLKTPLTAISGYSEVLKKMLEKGNTEKASENLDSIIESIKYTDSIISRTLEFSRLNDIREIKKEKISFAEISEELLKIYRPEFEKKNISVNTDIKGEIIASRETMTSAVENLISNAVKFTPENGTVSIVSDEKSFAVENTAKGKCDVNKIKMPFVKGDKSRGRTQGSGLGLSIVQNAADLNGIKFEIVSEEDIFKAVLHF